MMTRHARRVDANQAGIVAALRGVGAREELNEHHI